MAGWSAAPCVALVCGAVVWGSARYFLEWEGRSSGECQNLRDAGALMRGVEIADLPCRCAADGILNPVYWAVRGNVVCLKRVQREIEPGRNAWFKCASRTEACLGVIGVC